jgi:hypothetical protein
MVDRMNARRYKTFKKFPLCKSVTVVNFLNFGVRLIQQHIRTCANTSFPANSYPITCSSYISLDI